MSRINTAPPGRPERISKAAYVLFLVFGVLAALPVLILAASGPLAQGLFFVYLGLSVTVVPLLALIGLVLAGVRQLYGREQKLLALLICALIYLILRALALAAIAPIEPLLLHLAFGLIAIVISVGHFRASGHTANSGNVSSKRKTAGHVTAVIVALAGIGLMMFGKNLIDSAPTGDGGIYGLFGVLIILAGGLMTIVVAISWIFNAVVQVISWTFRTVAQQFGIKGIVVLVSIVLAAGYLILYSFPNISGG